MKKLCFCLRLIKHTVVVWSYFIQFTILKTEMSTLPQLRHWQCLIIWPRMVLLWIINFKQSVHARLHGGHSQDSCTDLCIRDLHLSINYLTCYSWPPTSHLHSWLPTSHLLFLTAYNNHICPNRLFDIVFMIVVIGLIMSRQTQNVTKQKQKCDALQQKVP